MIIHAPAKINLALSVGELLPNGLHSISTIMQTLDLSDAIRLEVLTHEAPPVTLQSNEPALCSPEDNLVFRAATAWLAEANVKTSLLLELNKRIPHAAGLGGGSSDAACTLLGLQRLFPQSALVEDRLNKIAYNLGSDVSFFLHKGTCLVTGSGEQVKPLPELPPIPLLLLCPKLHISTKNAFTLLDEKRASDQIAPLHRDSPWPLQPHEFQQYFQNDFFNIIAEQNESLKALLQDLQETRPIFASMSGSGPSLFGLYKSRHERDDAARYFEKKHPTLRQYRTCTTRREDFTTQEIEEDTTA